ILGHAKQTASWIFQQAGIEVLWIDCPTPITHKPPSYIRAETYPVLRITIVPASIADRLHLPPDKLGVSLQPDRVFVLYDRIDKVTSNTGAFYKPSVLGNVIAHELGHLLLPAEGHSQTGIMRKTYI